MFWSESIKYRRGRRDPCRYLHGGPDSYFVLRFKTSALLTSVGTEGKGPSWVGDRRLVPHIEDDLPSDRSTFRHPHGSLSPNPGLDPHESPTSLPYLLSECTCVRITHGARQGRHQCHLRGHPQCLPSEARQQGFDDSRVECRECR